MGHDRLKSASKVLAISDALRGGEEFTIDDVAEACDVRQAQARAYLKLIEDVQPVESKWRPTEGDGPGKKVWYWPLETYRNGEGARR